MIANNQIQHDSTITLPIEADLSALEIYLNDIIPDVLADINEPDKICVEAKYLKTKGMPKCSIKNYRISCEDRQIKIRTTPEIKCDINGWIKRNGHISLSGQGETLKFAFPVKAHVSTDIGLHGTADAAAILHISATPSINKDWTASVDVSPHFTWSQKPTLTLSESIKINIQSKVEPKLRDKMNEFVKKIPQLLTGLDMKRKVHTAWQDIQKPLKINDEPETYILFKPQSASYSGFNIVDNVLKTTISAKGKTEIILGKPNINYKETKLCDLGSIPCQEGTFSFYLPVSITYQELLEISNKELLDAHSIELVKSAVSGILKVSNPKIKKNSTDTITISAHINYDSRPQWLRNIDLFNWFDIEGEMTFSGSPRINKETRILVLDDLIYDSTTNNDLFDILVDAAELEPIKSHFSNLIKYEFGPKIDKGIIKANKALKVFSKGDTNISANLQMASIEDIMLDEKHITIHTKLSGKVNASIEL